MAKMPFQKKKKKCYKIQIIYSTVKSRYRFNSDSFLTEKRKTQIALVKQFSPRKLYCSSEGESIPALRS